MVVLAGRKMLLAFFLRIQISESRTLALGFGWRRMDQVIS
jgi:hypothetical protein